MPSTVRTRIAPTPSGYLHEGNLVSFLLTAAVAGDQGHILLRIDDLDRQRYRRAYVEDIFRTLELLRIPITAGPEDADHFEREWSQDYRLGDYQEALDKASRHPLVFACGCSRKELATGGHPRGCLRREISLDEPGVAWRVDTRQVQSPMVVPDLKRGSPFEVVIHDAAPDFALRRKSGKPSYQLACTVDDALFGINTVVRGAGSTGQHRGSVGG